MDKPCVVCGDPVSVLPDQEPRCPLCWDMPAPNRLLRAANCGCGEALDETGACPACNAWPGNETERVLLGYEWQEVA